MPKQGDFSVELVVGEHTDGPALKEVVDTETGRVYAISRAGDEYKVRLSGPGDKHVGAILQIDGAPSLQALCLSNSLSLTPSHLHTRQVSRNAKTFGSPHSRTSRNRTATLVSVSARQCPTVDCWSHPRYGRAGSDPAKGKFKGRVFGCPEQVADAGAASGVSDDIGVIRVFFFDVHRTGTAPPPRQLVPPRSPSRSPPSFTRTPRTDSTSEVDDF